MRLKIFFASLFLSLPLWWGMDIFSQKLEDFWFWKEMTENPQILSAQINQQILEKELKMLKSARVSPPEDLEIRARAAISVEINNKGNEKILFEKNSQQPLPIASLTKLMTALVVFDLDETYNLSQPIKISQKAVFQEGESKYADLVAGEFLSVESLLYIMLMESSNDAAYAITELIGQGAFVDLMNLYAKDLGLKNTYFANSTGLDPDFLYQSINLSTAQDLVKLAKYILVEYPQIFGITNNCYYEVLRPNGIFRHLISENTNELLAEFPEIIGGKTGWSLVADGCLLLVLESPRKNNYFINVVLGSKDRFGEMRKLIEQVDKIRQKQ